MDRLPLNERMLDLQGRIEAATQQATWVEALEEQIGRLDGQIDKAQKQSLPWLMTSSYPPFVHCMIHQN